MIIYDDYFLEHAKKRLDDLKKLPLDRLKEIHKQLLYCYLYNVENALTPEIEQVYWECLSYLEERASENREVGKENATDV